MKQETDLELLKNAAKAAGIGYDSKASKPHPKSNAWFGLWLVIHGEPHEYQRRYWNPLTDDGDALRLAVKLEFDVWIDGDAVEIFFGRDIGAKSLAIEYVGNSDAYAATRRAIVRAAAEIGKTK